MLVGEITILPLEEVFMEESNEVFRRSSLTTYPAQESIKVWYMQFAQKINLTRIAELKKGFTQSITFDLR